ncbi:peptidase HslV family [Edwardsiella phage PEi21]|uniref:Uncharacterized protein n=1 Tax=Edwardsiella phage PEi21 TaxID=1325372 RepID=N0DU93_9CAUD|nr:peptidase HslV family [Edwardsiella phage PEi21]BAN16842.1 hypothetical protein [Edwardsiella phage PEi21]
MTGIAWDGKTLAADKAEFRGNQMSKTTKISVHLVDGRHIAFAGTGYTEDILRVKIWIDRGMTGEIEGLSEGTKNCPQGMVLEESGEIFELYPCGALEQVESDVYASGSAFEFLTAAMLSGKTAHDAVALAIQHRSDCGYGINTITPDELKGASNNANR